MAISAHLHTNLFAMTSSISQLSNMLLLITLIWGYVEFSISSQRNLNLNIPSSFNYNGIFATAQPNWQTDNRKKQNYFWMSFLLHNEYFLICIKSDYLQYIVGKNNCYCIASASSSFVQVQVAKLLIHWISSMGDTSIRKLKISQKTSSNNGKQ